MSNNNNKTSVPEAKEAMNRFKYEVASELGVPLKDGYNGDLTSRQNGSVGGYMVKKMIEAQEKQMAGKYENTRIHASRIFWCHEPKGALTADDCGRRTFYIALSNYKLSVTSPRSKISLILIFRLTCAGSSSSGSVSSIRFTSSAAWLSTRASV